MPEESLRAGDKKCSRCKCRAPDKSQWECDYISIVGHSRGCPPGKKCKRFEEGERKQVIMDDWRQLRHEEEVDLYRLQKGRWHLRYLAEKNK